MNDTTTLRMERTFQAPAQAVFDAWTSEEVMRRRWHARTTGRRPRRRSPCAWAAPYGAVMRDPHKDVEYGGGGRYTEIDPPRRLAFTWFWDGNDRRQLIEIDFEEVEGSLRRRSRYCASASGAAPALDETAAVCADA